MKRLEAIVRADPDLMRLLTQLRGIGLPQWRIVSGCVFQTVWNVLTGRPRGTGILDYDAIYFDDADLSWEAEDLAIRRVASVTADCPGPVQLRNQARVHLWYESRFGTPCPPLRSSDESLLAYPHTASAVAVRLTADGRLDIAAPYGLDDLFAMVIRQSPGIRVRAVFEQKAERAKAIWPEATVMQWRAV